MTEPKFQAMKYVTPVEKMCQIIGQANDSKEGSIWDQDDMWEETLELISSKLVKNFTPIENILITTTFQDMLDATSLKDTGFDSYEQMMAAFLGPKVPTKATVSAGLPEQSEDNAQLISEAQAGNTEAMSKLGVLAEGEGDLVGARRWYEQAAGAGDTDAMTNLGVLAKGEGDLVGARRWWEQAAAAGQPVAMFKLGFLANGEGDLVGARRWYEQAAAAGHTGAMFNLGALAKREGDLVGARRWWEQAAAAGQPGAQFELKRLGEGA